MTATIPTPKYWDEIMKYSIYKNGFRVGLQEDAPKEVKEEYEKMKKEYAEATKKGTIL